MILMQIFDFHLHPKLRKDRFFKSFCFEPETKQEKVLGNLYIIAELGNSISKDAAILDGLANIIRKKFYSRLEMTPEQGLKESLRQANQYLNDLSKQGNVRWLGNLNIAVFNIKNSIINFSKTGNIKLLLLRGGEYLDISENLEFQNLSPSQPSQSFSNIASGRLIETDKIICLTQNIFDFFYADLAEKIVGTGKFNPRQINKILRQKKDKIKTLAGVLFIISMEEAPKKRFGLSLPRISLPSFAISKELLLVLLLIFILFLSYMVFKLKK